MMVGAALGFSGCGSKSARPAPSCEVSPNALAFGTVLVGDALTRVVTLFNTGEMRFTASLSLQGMEFELPSDAPGDMTLAPGDSADILVVFQPAAVGAASGSLHITGGSCPSVALAGSGESPCSVSPDHIDFDRVSVGRSESRAFTVANSGAAPLSGTVSANCPEFTIREGGGPFTLVGGDSFQVVVELDAATLGPKTCIVNPGLPLCPAVTCTGQASRTWEVLADGSGDAPTVQAAIDSATAGEIVLVHPGTYHEVIDFKGKDIIVRSSSGPEVTILDGSGFTGVAVVTFQSGESRAACLEGFTVTHGERGIKVHEAQPTIRSNFVTLNGGVRDGAGIWCYVYDLEHGVWAPLIRENRVTENTAGNIAGGIGASYGMTPEILDNYIAANRAIDGDAGGVYCVGVNDGAVIRGNTIVGNFAGDHGGGVYAGSPIYGTVLALELSWNVITGNTANGREGTGDSGGGVWLWETAAWVHNNTIASNAGYGEGTPNGGGLVLLRPSSPVVEQNIIAFSQAGGGIWCSGESTPIIRSNLAWQNTGGDGVGSCPSWWQSNGNIVADPLFCDAGSGDYSLAANSPALLHPAGPLGAFPTAGCGAASAVTTPLLLQRLQSGLTWSRAR